MSTLRARRSSRAHCPVPEPGGRYRGATMASRQPSSGDEPPEQRDAVTTPSGRPPVPPPPPPRPIAPPAADAGAAAEPANRWQRFLAQRRERQAPAGAPAGPPTDLRPLRYRVLPRSAIGISIAVLCFAFGASLSGVVLYSYYAYRLNQEQTKVNNLTGNIQSRRTDAVNAIKAQEADAQNLINQQIAPLKSVLATGQTVQQLIAKVSPAVYFVHTLDDAGQPAVGTAFAVASTGQQTLLLTSYTTVAAATRKPGPALFVRHGNNDQAATVYTWDTGNDLALIILSQGNLPTLSFTSSPPKVGERVFAVSGLGANGAAITQGFVADVSANGIQHDAKTGTQFQGGPLLNSEGKVVGILSRTYSPLGFPVSDVWFAIPPANACQRVLQCPNGTPAQSSSSGAQQTP
jgi:S1-C subfamily serine protease